MDNYLVFEWYISMSQMVLTIKLENNSKYKKYYFIRMKHNYELLK